MQQKHRNSLNRILFNFTQKQEIVYSGQLHEWQEDYNLLHDFTFDSVFVLVNPGSYMGIRKSLAIVHGIEITQNIEATGIDLLDYLNLFGPSVAFLQGSYVWYRINRGETQLCTLDKIPPNAFMISNIKINANCEIVPCDSLSIYNFLDRLPKLPVKQLFFDKFNFFM